eukprot:1663518-Pyramimonas_sp.AAC.1
MKVLRSLGEIESTMATNSDVSTLRVDINDNQVKISQLGDRMQKIEAEHFERARKIVMDEGERKYQIHLQQIKKTAEGSAAS